MDTPTGRSTHSHTVQNPVIAGEDVSIDPETSIVNQTAYDDKGNETAKTDGNGNTVAYTYDDQNRVTKVSQGDNSTSISYAMRNAGVATTSITDAMGHENIEVANAAGLTETTTSKGNLGESISTKFTYDTNGNKTKETYENGAYKTYHYDKKNRLTETNTYEAPETGSESGTRTLKTSYSYDGNDQLIEMVDYQVSGNTETAYRYTECEYDGLQRKTIYAELSQSEKPTADEIRSHAIKYTYDAEGRLTKVTYPTKKDGVRSLFYHYTSDGWLSVIKADVHKGSDAKEATVRTYVYDDYGKVTEIKDDRNLLSDGDKVIKKVYTYDTFDRVSKMAYTDLEHPDTVVESYAYSYDKNSNIVEKTQVNNYPQKDEEKVNETKHYTYDSLGRLEKTVTTYHRKEDSKQTVTYTYDKVGNRLAEDKGDTKTTYNYNGLDQVTTSTTWKDGTAQENKQYVYDKNGNEIGQTNIKTGEILYRAYDAENRLSEVSVNKDGKNAVVQQNQYNGDGQRIQRVEGEQTTSYYYQDGVVSYTTDGKGEQTSQDLLGTDGNIIGTQRYTGNDPAYYVYNKDVQGSTTNLVRDDGKADVSYRYEDFGETTSVGENTSGNETCYTGGRYDETTGLYYLNARYYNPEDGRFLSEDTYRGETNEPDTQHLYAYCADNPVNYVDPSGHKFLGYWSSKQHYYAFNQNAPQKYAGYNDFYDMNSWAVGDLTTRKIETSHWRLQFWKGIYGPPYVPAVANGCEIGLYYRKSTWSKHWNCAYDSNKRLRMRMSLYANGKKLFTRDSKTSTDQGKAWWLTGFTPRPYLPKKKTWGKTTLKMTGTLWFPSSGKYRSQMRGLSKKLAKVKSLNVKGSLTRRTFSWKGW